MSGPPTLEDMLAREGLNQTWNGDLVSFKYAQSVLWTEGWEWDWLAREARGITYNSGSESNRCICRPFAKFFNLGEESCKADVSSAFLTAKLDGTCILAYRNPIGQLAAKTLGGFNNEFTALALPLLRQAFNTAEKLALLETDTPVFELLSTIAGSGVIRHEGPPQIVLLAVRSIKTGLLMPRVELQRLAGELGVPLVGLVDLTAEEALRESRGEWDGNLEGYVGIDHKQRLFKIKFTEFVRLHRLAGSLKSTKNYFARAIPLIEKYPAQVAHICPSDDIIGALNVEVARIGALVAPLLEPSWKEAWKKLGRAGKKAALAEVSKEYHSLVLGFSLDRPDRIKALAIRNLDAANYARAQEEIAEQKVE